ncbi:MAG: hypothetical protein ABI699_09345 [Caldimonas sp.]
MAAGQITVDLLLRTGSFSTDTARAAKDLKKLQAEAEAIGKAVAVAFVGVAAATLAMANKSLAAVDAFNDLKDATGASIENISAIDRVARETGVGFDTVQASLIKLNQALNAATPDSGASRALQAIGLSAKDLKTLDPAEALRRVAVALAGFADDGSKARITQELFGKSLREVAPLLVDLAKKGELVATTTTEQALAVEEYRKQSFKLKADIEDLARSFTITLLPSIVETGQQIRALFGGSKPVSALAADVIAAEKFVDASRARLSQGDSILDIVMSGTRAKREENLRRDEALLVAARAAYQKAVGTSTAGAGRGFGYPMPSAGDFTAKPDKPAASGRIAKERDDYAALIKSITEKIAVGKAELESEDRLSEAQKQGAKIARDYSAGIITLTSSQLEQLDAELKVADETERAIEVRDAARQREVDWLRQATESNAVFIDSLLQGRDAYIEEAKAAELEVELFGLSEKAVDKLATARLRDVAASKLQKAEKAEAAGLDDVAAAYRKQAEAILRTADAKEVLAAAKAPFGDAKQLNESLRGNFENEFASFIDGSKSASQAFKSFADGVISDLARIAAKKLALEFFGDGSKDSTGGLFGDLIKAFGSFAGGFAEGGFIPPGKFALVGERGPELAISGPSGKTIVPLDGSGNGRGGTVQHFHITVPQSATVDRHTALQRGRDFGSGIRQAMARNG